MENGTSIVQEVDIEEVLIRLVFFSVSFVIENFNSFGCPLLQGLDITVGFGKFVGGFLIRTIMFVCATFLFSTLNIYAGESRTES